MKKRRFYSFSVLLLLLAFLSSCGGGGAGAPGSSGSDETGVMLDAYVVPFYKDIDWDISNNETSAGTLSTITYDGNLTNKVDVTQTPDCDPTNDKDDPEYFGDHQALLVINARLLNPTSPFKPGNLFITHYTIDYYRSSDSLTAPPIETARRNVNIMIGTVSPSIGNGNRYSAAVVEFVDIIRKLEYVRLIDGGMYTSRPGYLNNYTAEYTFYGKDSYGKSFSFKVRHDFSMGSYDNCGIK